MHSVSLFNSLKGVHHSILFSGFVTPDECVSRVSLFITIAFELGIITSVLLVIGIKLLIECKPKHLGFNF